MESIISACIGGGFALIGVIITAVQSDKKLDRKLMATQEVMRVEIDNLTREVRKHNDFASRVPVLEAKIEMLEKQNKE